MRIFLHAWLTALLLNCAVTLSSAIADDSFYDVPAPGQRLDLGGYKLHINCQGTGSPTVILDAGLGDWSTHWTSVQNLLKADTRVCSYDRAGYGWSDPGPRPRDSLRIITELHSLLDKAKIEPPYLLVGHSFGGINMRLFSSAYPNEVSGLVLVEASHPESLPYRRNEQGETHSPAPYLGNQLMVIHPVDVDESKFPPEAIPAIHDNLLHTKSLVTSRGEYRALAFSVSELLQAPPIGNIPLTVITRGTREWPTGKDGDAQEKSWHEQQAELTKLSSIGTQRMAQKSGHHAHIDEPEVVADAVRDLVTAERKKLAFAAGNK
jgi:pimeloyl-ACP methyl ester carboxylesterase